MVHFLLEVIQKTNGSVKLLNPTIKRLRRRAILTEEKRIIMVAVIKVVSKGKMQMRLKEIKGN